MLCCLLQPLVGADAAADAFFTGTVQPLLEARCLSCHGEKKQKGKLRLDAREAWLKGGENGKIVEEGHPEKSSVVPAIKWESKDEDMNMPPKKDKKLSAEQVKVIEEWIKAGLPWGK